jgi:hypothetical protein
MRTASTGKLGKPIREVAEGGAARDSDDPESGHGDTRACI